MTHTFKPVYYEDSSGNPLTGLTVTATCKDLTLDQVLFTNSPCAEDADMAGFYKIKVSGHENHEFAISFVTAGAAANPKQAYTFVLLDKPNRGGFSQTIKQDLSEDQLKTIAKELAKSVIIPEYKQLDNTKQIDELVKKHIKSIPRQEIDLSGIDSTKKELKTILGALEAQITTHKKELQQEIKNFDNKQVSMLGQSDKVLKKLESQVEKSEAIVRALTKFMDTVVSEVTSNVADFLTAIEVKKQEALGNDKMKKLAVDTYKQFKQFKIK